MAAGDMGWSDCGRKSQAQFFYGNRKGRRQVGRCGQNETRIALYAQRLEGRWKKLFKMKHDREPSGEELWAALRTGEIAVNVKDWENQFIGEDKTLKNKTHIHRGSGGRRMTTILADFCAKQQLIKEEAIKAKLEEEEAHRIKYEEHRRRYEITKSSEVPKPVLYRLVAGKVPMSAVCLLFGVNENRVEVLIEAFQIRKRQS